MNQNKNGRDGVGRDEHLTLRESHLSGLHRVGLYYAKKNGGSQDDMNAVGCLRESAEGGYAPAQRDLGRMYELGRVMDTGEGSTWIGTPSDESRWRKKEWDNICNAEKWYLRASEQNDVLAMYYLACLYDGDSGKMHNDKEAIVFYEKAALAGCVPAQLRLACKYKRIFSLNDCEYKIKALEWYKKAKDAGSRKAKEEFDGWWNRLMRCETSGDVGAMEQLGVMYESGRLVEKNLERGAELRERAKCEGLVRTLERFKKAKESGDEEAGRRFDDQWTKLMRLIEHGDEEAAQLLSFMYKYGRIVEKDLKKAKEVKDQACFERCKSLEFWNEALRDAAERRKRKVK